MFENYYAKFNVYLKNSSAELNIFAVYYQWSPISYLNHDLR